jgi:hypothetical protein
MTVRLSALLAGRPPFIPRKIPGTHLCSIEKSDDLNGNRARHHSACSIVPNPTVLPFGDNTKFYSFYIHAYITVSEVLEDMNTVYYGMTQCFLIDPCVISEKRPFSILKIKDASIQKWR